MKPVLERRSHRSEEPHSALGMQLERTRQNGRLEAVVLADTQGLAIAYAGDADLCRALSAIAPLAPHARASCLSELTGGGDVAVRALRPLGSPLFLAALGGTAARDAVLSSAAAGVERILQRN